MHANLALSLSTLFGFLLVLARVSGVIAFVPIPGLSAGPAISRVVLSLALTISLSSVWPQPADGSQSVGRLLGWIGSEAAFGLTMGLAISFLLEGIQMAAQIIGLQAGFSYASTVDPNTQADSTSLQIMSQLFAGSLFFALGFDRSVVEVLAKSLERIPAGTYALSGQAVNTVLRLGSAIFTTGLQLALPILALLLLLDIAFAVLGRLQTQLQLLSLSFSLKMLVAMAFLASVIRFFPAVFAKTAAATFTLLLQLLH